jgi:hypothetical protein
LGKVFSYFQAIHTTMLFQMLIVSNKILLSRGRAFCSSSELHNIGVR